MNGKINAWISGQIGTSHRPDRSSQIARDRDPKGRVRGWLCSFRSGRLNAESASARVYQLPLVEARQSRFSEARATYLVGLCLALSACGGGGGGGNNAAPVQAAPTPPKVITVSAEGDSTMWGYQVVNNAAVQSPNNVPVELQKMLGVPVINNAIPATTVCERLSGDAPYKAPLSAELATNAAQIYIGNWAINDSSMHIGEPLATFQGCLVEFVTQVRAAGKTVVLEEPNPVTNATFPALADYVAAIDYVATQMNVPLVRQYSYIQTVPGWQSMLTDGIHPNDAMYLIKAQQEAIVLAPIIKSLQ